MLSEQCKSASASVPVLWRPLLRDPRDGLTVVNVIEVLVRIMGIVDDERAAQAVAVLRRYVAVVPERARLADGREVVQERVGWLDGTLRDERGAVRPGRSVLEDSVPVLPVVRVR